MTLDLDPNDYNLNPLDNHRNVIIENMFYMHQDGLNNLDPFEIETNMGIDFTQPSSRNIENELNQIKK